MVFDAAGLHEESQFWVPDGTADGEADVFRVYTSQTVRPFCLGWTQEPWHHHIRRSIPRSEKDFPSF